MSVKSYEMKKCAHFCGGFFPLLHKYIISDWELVERTDDGISIYSRKIISKLQCPGCKALFLRQSNEFRYDETKNDF